MNLTAENVEKIFSECCSENEENANVYTMIAHTFVFDKDKLKENEQNITDMLHGLPENFMKEKGGGWSFLQACVDKNGAQWTGQHLLMEELFALGMGIEKVECLLPREIWSALPGGMPYYVVL